MDAKSEYDYIVNKWWKLKAPRKLINAILDGKFEIYKIMKRLVDNFVEIGKLSQVQAAEHLEGVIILLDHLAKTAFFIGLEYGPKINALRNKRDAKLMDKEFQLYEIASANIYEVIDKLVPILAVGKSLSDKNAQKIADTARSQTQIMFVMYHELGISSSADEFVITYLNGVNKQDNKEQKNNLKKCPYCAEEIKAEATFCRYCNHDL